MSVVSDAVKELHPDVSCAAWSKKEVSSAFLNELGISVLWLWINCIVSGFDLIEKSVLYFI